MEFELSDAKFFKSCIDAIVNLVDEGTFEVSGEGLKLRTMDPSQIAMVDFHLPKDAFDKLEAEDKANVSVNLADLAKILARSRAGEKLNVKLEEKESRLLLEFTGQSKRKFRLPLIESNATLPREPRVPFDVEVKLKGGALKDMLRDAGLLSSHVVLNAEGDEFIVEAHGDSGDLRIETTKGSGEVSEIKIKAASRAMFPYEYLDDITRACPDDAVMEVGLKSDAPVRIAYVIGKAKLAYYLAPRVENV